jgi:hypothetical protein
MEDTFEVKNEAITARMRGIGQRIHQAINESESAGKMGFALFLFDFGEEGAVFYISDARREDMIRILEQFIERQRKEV